MPRRILPTLALAAMGAFHGQVRLAAQAGPTDSVRIERLASLGQLWVAIRTFHPWLAYRPITWDAALAAAIPQVSAAPDRAAFSAAVRDMVATLRDPVTRLEPDRPAQPARSEAEPDPRSWWTVDSLLVISLRNGADLDDFNRTIERLTRIADTVRRARRVVFDLRTTSPSEEGIDWALGETGILSLFAPTPARAPDQRGRLHSGFVPENGQTSGGYSSGFYTVDGPVVPAGDSTASSRTAVLLVNEQSIIPQGMLALRNAGRASIVAENGTSEAGVVRTYAWALPDSLRATIRLTDLLAPGGPGVPMADTTVPAAPTSGRASSDAALVAAVAAFARPARPGGGAATWPTASAPPAVQDSAATAAYPSLVYRLMAAFRIWAVGQYFFPYRELMHERWDRVLVEAIPRLEAARDSAEYGLALAEMAAHLHDSHVWVTSPALRAHFGTGFPPFYVRMIEGQPVITHFTDDTAARRGGLRVGDVILSVDGENAHSRMRRWARYISASTPQALERVLALRQLVGPLGSTIRLRVRGAGGTMRAVELTRGEHWEMTGRTGPMVRIIPGNIGYADLGRLPADQVDSMFEQLKDTRAIVFDMRGYPLGTAWPIAPRLTRAESPAAARFTRTNPMSPDTTERDQLTFTQTLPRTDKWRYLRPTVMLIDERTMSQAEHTGLFLEAANGTRFVGTPTSGANGDVTVVALPGGVTMSFTGQAVRHGDGRQLQRIGLVPDVTVRPTITGIRAGRDEVLVGALRYLERRLRSNKAR